MVLVLCTLSFFFLEQLWRRPEYVLILDAYRMNSSAALVLEILTKTYLPGDTKVHRMDEFPVEPHNGGNELNYYFSHEHDPRLLRTFWLSYLSLRIQKDNDSALNDLLISFSWNILLDLQSRLHALNISHLGRFDCTTFQKLHKLNRSDFIKNCQNLKDLSNDSGQFRIIQPTDSATSEEARKTTGSSYLLHSTSISQRVCLLGLGPINSGVITATFSSDKQDFHIKEGLFNFIKTLTESRKFTI